MYSMKSIGLSLFLAGMALFSSTVSLAEPPTVHRFRTNVDSQCSCISLSQTFVDAQVIAQAMVKPLAVRPGGRITATLNFVVSSFASNATDPAIAVGVGLKGRKHMSAG